MASEESNTIIQIVEYVNSNPPLLGHKINITEPGDVNNMLETLLKIIDSNDEKICNQVIEIFQKNFPSFYNDIKSYFTSQ